MEKQLKSIKDELKKAGYTTVSVTPAYTRVGKKNPKTGEVEYSSVESTSLILVPAANLTGEPGDPDRDYVASGILEKAGITYDEQSPIVNGQALIYRNLSTAAKAEAQAVHEDNKADIKVTSEPKPQEN
jgi:hypothetical protein